MKFENFDVHATPFITNAYCKKCNNELVEVSNGWFSKAMFCPKCEIVYTVKLVKVPDSKVNKEYIAQCRKEATPKKNNKDD